MAMTPETSQADEPKTYGEQKCEQGCLEIVEQCEEAVSADVDACRAEFLKCVDSCQALLSPNP